MNADPADLPWPYNVSLMHWLDEEREWLSDLLDYNEGRMNDNTWAIHEQRYAERQVYKRNLE